jgi:hypothetical protein
MPSETVYKNTGKRQEYLPKTTNRIREEEYDKEKKTINNCAKENMKKDPCTE